MIEEQKTRIIQLANFQINLLKSSSIESNEKIWTEEFEERVDETLEAMIWYEEDFYLQPELCFNPLSRKFKESHTAFRKEIRDTLTGVFTKFKQEKI